MFFTLSQIEQSLKKLESVHHFFGITFLVCKRNSLPVGKAIEFPISRAEQGFIEKYYRPDKNTLNYFQVFGSPKKKYWLKPDYIKNSCTGTRTNKFKLAFEHSHNKKLWGWKQNYVEVLKKNLRQNRPVPAFDLAVWLYREREWQPGTSYQDVLETFFNEFQITEQEKTELFDTSIPNHSNQSPFLQETEVLWDDITRHLEIPAPPDAPKDEGGALENLILEGVGPTKRLHLEFKERINLLTGDNGLGKSFILESAWWALSGNWAGFPVYPREDAKRDEPKIHFKISGHSGKPYKGESTYNWNSQEWVLPNESPTIPGLLIYARVDGAFAVWDPAKEYWGEQYKANQEKQPLIFLRDEVWHGISTNSSGQTKFLFNGLIHDWVFWQNSPKKQPFETLKKVLRRLSPPDLKYGDLGLLEPGTPTRIPRDSRWIPTIKHSYGDVPLVYASAGVRRIVAMAYLIVWAWEEHKEQSKLIRKPPQRRMVILVDEIEAHLHPQWQRLILPALLDVWQDLDIEIQVQFLIATHSPLIMASLEPRFQTDKDKIFHLNLVQKDLFGSEVALEEPEFVRYGTVDSWLRSNIFELRDARSVEAENAIEQAKMLQTKDDITKEDVQELSERLTHLLSSHDTFWIRWKFFAEKHGVIL